ncbi:MULTISPECIES: hypothetical protein [Bosea]|jgi:hypothetical protein|uniref:DUF6894 family protein n=1 Tax=Bosea TaxID=85413 RepID=UPI00214FB119|nr:MULTISPECIES: hypothetical protein [Bosea]MCR4524529.1 hypothetical protein [Bosea sp. 47.2.35]MDR6831596.1 hypothetical protein [Bosea robiniae]MDR6898327.1 hypothetical protein [Bosea sp. BE109]MDR7141702.1 hypothetical protein [Bosea sp. BE168]MDR7178334.1 hypothetical protein [Bosea sp. BE271]
MPTYNVRMDVGEGPDGGEPMEFSDTSAARRDAQIAMTEMARDHIPGKRKAHLAVEIDDDKGAAIYRAKLEFSCYDGQEPEAAPEQQISNGPRE